MSDTTARTKRVRATSTNGDTAAPARRTRAKRAPAAAAAAFTAEQRRTLIAERAYLRAEQRGFQGGDPVEDWLASEREVDQLLAHTS